MFVVLGRKRSDNEAWTNGCPLTPANPTSWTARHRDYLQVQVRVRGKNEACRAYKRLVLNGYHQILGLKEPQNCQITQLRKVGGRDRDIEFLIQLSTLWRNAYNLIDSAGNSLKLDTQSIKETVTNCDIEKLNFFR